MGSREASEKSSQFIKLKLDCVELDEQECVDAAHLGGAKRHDVTRHFPGLLREPVSANLRISERVGCAEEI